MAKKFALKCQTLEKALKKRLEDLLQFVHGQEEKEKTNTTLEEPNDGATAAAGHSSASRHPNLQAEFSKLKLGALHVPKSTGSSSSSRTTKTAAVSLQLQFNARFINVANGVHHHDSMMANVVNVENDKAEGGAAIQLSNKTRIPQEEHQEAYAKVPFDILVCAADEANASCANPGRQKFGQTSAKMEAIQVTEMPAKLLADNKTLVLALGQSLAHTHLRDENAFNTARLGVESAVNLLKTFNSNLINKSQLVGKLVEKLNLMKIEAEHP